MQLFAVFFTLIIRGAVLVGGMVAGILAAGFARIVCVLKMQQRGATMSAGKRETSKGLQRQHPKERRTRVIHCDQLTVRPAWSRRGDSFGRLVPHGHSDEPVHAQLW